MRVSLPPSLRWGFFVLSIPMTIYFGLLGLVIVFPAIQTHAFYLHRLSLTWFKDLNVPDTWGFLPNQVTPFSISTIDGETLHAWHVLPLGVYQRNQKELLNQQSGFTSDFTSLLSFKLLQDDPETRLVIYLHGATGTIASGWRPDSYRTLYSAAPDKIHVLTVDYRGHGYSTGTPSEEGLLRDAIAMTDWAVRVAGIPSSRILIYGQSLGTAVAISLAHHFAMQSPPVSFAGLVLVATFSDVATLTGTYWIGGLVLILTPLRQVSHLLTFVNSFLISTWMNKKHIAEFVRLNEEKSAAYHITLIHAEDDFAIDSQHSDAMFWHAVNATTPSGISYGNLDREKEMTKTNLGNGGWSAEWRTRSGVIREEIVKFGGHDQLMSYPATALAVLRAFQETDPTFSS